MEAVILISLFIQFSFTSSQSSFYAQQQQQQVQVKVGGLFDRVDSPEEVTLKLAMEQINRDTTLLPYHHLTVKSETIDDGNSFYSSKAVCSLLREGIVGIFGPQSQDAASHVQSLCDRFDIPHIETQWDYRTRQDKYAINLYPHPDTMGQAYANLVDDRGWGNFAVLYDNEDGLFKLQNLIRTAVPQKRNITVRLLPAEDFRPVLKSLQREHDVKNLIVDSDAAKTLEVLRQAEQVGMTRYDYSYILTTLDLQPTDMDEYKYGDAQFYAYRLVDLERPEVQAISRELNSNPESHSERLQEFPAYNFGPRGITTSQALIFDAVKLFSKALHENLEMIKEVQPLNCNENEGWTEGSTLLNDMRAMPSFQGLTGAVQFNNSGFRTDITLTLVKVTRNGLVKAGTWDYARFSNNRISWFASKEEAVEKDLTALDTLPLVSRRLKVTTTLTNPIIMYKLSQDPQEGNQRFEGFGIDLIEELSQRLGFNYTLQLVGDGTYPGMVREVEQGIGDLVLADLTVTEERQRILDFTMPFMNLGISILFVPPQAKPPSLFSFMSPFALEVWIYVAFAFFGVSLVLFIVARVTPLEWDNPLPCITDPEKLHNQFKMSNSIWFTLGSIMQQGSDLAPKAVSTRIIAGIWWFFTLIMVSSYTANLSAFLIVQEMEEPFKTLEDLAAQNKIQYGCMAGGSTSTFFSKANGTKQQIWKNMEQWGHVLKASNDDGITAVREKPGKYAFFMESTAIEYNIERKCGLAQVGGLLDSKGYGIALRKNSPYLDLFNGGILKLQENGKLDELKRKWWKEQRKESAETCPVTSASDSVSALQLANVGGVFVVLVVGCIASFFITCFEIIINSRNFRPNQEESRVHEIFKDLQFALQCRGNVKPVRKKSGGPSLGNSKEELGKYTSNKSLAD